MAAPTPSIPRDRMCGANGVYFMDITALFLLRLQFAFTVSFHIIFPSFTIGLAAWLTVLEASHLATVRSAYRLVFEFWLKIFGMVFGRGGLWSELSRC
jgi:cytochrome bd-type quinol oxidase subunit 1